MLGIEFAHEAKAGSPVEVARIEQDGRHVHAPLQLLQQRERPIDGEQRPGAGNQDDIPPGVGVARHASGYEIHQRRIFLEEVGDRPDGVLDGGGTFQATQIKEKYGTLRFYWTGTLSPEADARVEEAIDLAEARSCVTCEICGESGVLHGPSWFTTRCALHAEGRRPIKAQPGDDIHVIERIVGKRRSVLRRRYDRDRDTFVEVDPFGTEEN